MGEDVKAPGAKRVVRTVRRDGAVVLEQGSSRATLKHYGSGVFVTFYEGICVGAFMQPTLDEWTPLLRSGQRLTLFADLRKMTSYETEYRQEMTRWIREHMQEFAGFHVYTQSEIVRMGLNLANAVIQGSITAYSDLLAFERAIKQRAPAFEGLQAFTTGS